MRYARARRLTRAARSLAHGAPDIMAAALEAGYSSHEASIRSTWLTIWTQWLPNSGHEVVDAPDFERYSEQFNPQTGLGGFEIWLPIKG
jgi:predicted transcriptional regulator YdeE